MQNYKKMLLGCRSLREVHHFRCLWQCIHGAAVPMHFQETSQRRAKALLLGP